MEAKAVSDSGPIIHLNEINFLESFNIFNSVLIPEEVESEIKKHKIYPMKKIRVAALNTRHKDIVKILTNQKDLGLGESEAISLAIQEKPCIFLTDDLEARNIAKEFSLDVHGSLGIILRAFREELINLDIAIKKINELQSKSSLFITRDLIENAIKAVKSFKRKQ
jgi:predicted nucleic acid-binding protein